MKLKQKKRKPIIVIDFQKNYFSFYLEVKEGYVKLNFKFKKYFSILILSYPFLIELLKYINLLKALNIILFILKKLS